MCNDCVFSSPSRFSSLAVTIGVSSFNSHLYDVVGLVQYSCSLQGLNCDTVEPQLYRPQLSKSKGQVFSHRCHTLAKPIQFCSICIKRLHCTLKLYPIIIIYLWDYFYMVCINWFYSSDPMSTGGGVAAYGYYPSDNNPLSSHDGTYHPPTHITGTLPACMQSQHVLYYYNTLFFIVPPVANEAFLRMSVAYC